MIPVRRRRSSVRYFSFNCIFYSFISNLQSSSRTSTLRQRLATLAIRFVPAITKCDIFKFINHLTSKECSERGGEMEHIVGARFILQGHKILNSNDESKLVHELREICHASKYNVTVFHPYFIYFDQV